MEHFPSCGCAMTVRPARSKPTLQHVLKSSIRGGVIERVEILIILKESDCLSVNCIIVSSVFSVGIIGADICPQSPNVMVPIRTSVILCCACSAY